MVIERADDLLRKGEDGDLLLVDCDLLEDLLQVADFVGRDAEVERDVAVEQFGQGDEAVDDHLNYAALGGHVQGSEVFVLVVAIGCLFGNVEGFSVALRVAALVGTLVGCAAEQVA